MRVLVTGDRGYIGSALVPRLLERGHDVVGVDAGFFESEGGGDDIRDVEACRLDGVDAVIHLAALSNDPMGNLDPNLTEQINYEASVRLARLAKSGGVRRFLFSSSCSNYGAAGREIMTEESPLNPVTAYGRSKVQTETAVRLLADDSFSPVFLRNATAYGVARSFRCDLVVNNLTAWAFTTGKVRVMSDGTAWRPLVHVDDIARAFVAALEAPREVIHNQLFNIGRTEENYRVRDVAEIIEREMPGVSIEYASRGGPDARDYRVSFEKAERTLVGYAPQWTVRDSIPQLLELYAKAGLTAEDIEGPRFARIARIRELLAEGALDAQLHWCPRRDSNTRPTA